MSVDKAAVQRELQQAWEDIRAVVGSLAEQELLEPGVCDEWSVKDLLAHIAFWNRLAAGNLQALAAGRLQDVRAPTDEQEVAALNKRESEQHKDLSLTQAKEDWLASFEAARRALDEATPDTLNQQAGGWAAHARFAVDTHLHYREHAAQIRAWQRQLETTEV